MKFLFVTFILCASVFASNAQVAVIGPNTVIASNGGFPPSSHFLNILQLQAQKLLGTPGGLPEDLEQRVADTLSNAEAAFAVCDASAQPTLPWIQIRCITLQLKVSKNELGLIEDEANARAAAAAATTVAASSAVV